MTNKNIKLPEIKIFHHIGKSGEKFVCMKFESIFKVKREVFSSIEKQNRKTSIDLLKEVMDRICEK